MVKKFIWISLVILCALGCGSRSTHKEKSLQKINETVKTLETANISTDTKTEEVSGAKEQKSEIAEENQSKIESINNNTEKNSQRTNSENNTKTLKKTEYYETGQKKSETEVSESYSKLSDEKDYYKNISESLRNDLKKSKTIQNSIYEQNLKLVRNNKERVKLNKESISMLERTNLELKKASERKGISFGNIVWIIAISLIAGAILWEIIKKYLPTKILSIFKFKKDELRS